MVDGELDAEYIVLESHLKRCIRNDMYRTMVEDLEGMPPEFREFPFQQYIAHAVEVMATRATAERLLWHQRLGHPSDHYLHHAHEHIDGVPRFKHFESVLEQCRTCIRAKQSKEAAGDKSTRTAEQPGPID
jgi:hypothetical protein